MMAAAAAFSELGFSQSSLERIAADAGVTRGSVYGHFRDKRDLLNAVSKLIDWPSLNGKNRHSETGASDPIGDLRRTVHAWMTDIHSNPVKRCVLDILLHKTEWTEENAELLERLHRCNHEVAQRIHGLLDEAAAKGALCLPVSTQVASVTLQAALLGIVSTSLRSATTGRLPGCGDWLVTALLAPSQGHKGVP